MAETLAAMLRGLWLNVHLWAGIRLAGPGGDGSLDRRIFDHFRDYRCGHVAATARQSQADDGQQQTRIAARSMTRTCYNITLKADLRLGPGNEG